MKVSVIIPCYNEIGTISTLVNSVLSVTDLDKEIVLIDDFSIDGTREMIVEKIESQVDTVIYHDRNMGKGAAIRSGIQASTGEIVIIQDSDLEYNPKEIPRVIQPIIDNKADVVYGSRFMGSAPHRVLFFWHMMGNRFLTLLSNMVTNLNLTDMETCYKAFRSEIIKSIDIEENRFGFEPEITAKIARSGCRIFEVGISYYGRTYQEGKKIGIRDGFRALWCIMKYNVFVKR